MAELATPNLTLPTTTAMAEFISGGIDEEPLLIRRSYSYYDRFLDYDREEGVMPRRTGDWGDGFQSEGHFLSPPPTGEGFAENLFFRYPKRTGQNFRVIEERLRASGDPGRTQ